MARNYSLDGLRGVAAFTVVLYHFACGLIPTLIPGEAPRTFWLVDTPLGVLFNGPFAVIVFFVLSGYVLSASAARRRNGVASNLFCRWLRLGVPAMFASNYGWALLSAFPDALHHLKTVLPHRWLGYSYDGDLPPLWYAAYDGAVKIFFSRASQFNSVLWTMRAEMIGSVAIYLIYGLTQGRVRQGLILLFLVAPMLVHRCQFSAFAAGVLLQEHRAALPKTLAWPALAVGVLLGAMHEGFSARLGLPQLPGVFALGDLQGVFFVLGATAFVYVVLVSPAVSRVLASPGGQWLGRMSFPIYLVHVPLIYTVCAALYGQLPVALIFAIFLALVFAIGWLALVAVDEPVLRLIRVLQGRRVKPQLQGAAPA